MKKNYLASVLKHCKAFAFSFAPLFLCGACTELSQLSTDTKVGGFIVDSIFTPGLTVLEEPQIVDSAATIYIPVEFDAYVKESAIMMSAVISKNHRTQKILNINPDSIVFSGQDGTVSFWVAAESGDTREWTIKLQGRPRSSATTIRYFGIKSYSAGSIVSDSAYVISDKHRVQVIAPEVHWPLTVTPGDIVLADGASLVEPFDSLTFPAQSTVHTFSVMAEDGTTQEWEMLVELCYPIYNEINDTQNADQLFPINVDAASFYINLLGQGENKYVRTNIDSVDNQLSVVLRNDNATTMARSYLPTLPVTLQFGFAAREGSEVLGYTMGDTLVFNSMDEARAFYIVDRENTLKKRWKVVLSEWQNSEADVLGFSLVGSTPAAIEIDEENIEIENSIGQIIVPILDGTDKFPLQLKAKLTLSDFASVRNFTNGLYYTFDNIESTKEFTVVAEDGTEKQWTIRLIFAGTLNTEAEVESFTVTQKSTPASKLTLEPAGVIDKAGKTITLKITDFSDDMPLQVKANMALSYRASVIGTDITQDWITFNSVDEKHTFTVQAQDGVTTNDWTLCLADFTPEKSNMADLTSCTVSNVAAGYTLGNRVIDQANKIIKVPVTVAGSGALSFAVKVAVSDKATLSGDITNTNAKTLTFGSISHNVPFNPADFTKSFSITSEDGSVTNNWTIAVTWEPQLANGDMETWTNNTTPGGNWSSANNSMVTMTTKAVSGNNTYAQLKATSLMGNFAAGNIFLGYFKMDLGQISTPKKMTYFGIPWTAKPTSLTTDIYYQPGGSSDMGSIEIHLLHYDGPAGSFEYHTLGTEANVTIVGKGRAEFGATGDWVSKTVPVEYLSDLQPTHIHVAYSTSYRGDDLIGETGSLMYVDNVVLNY